MELYLLRHAIAADKTEWKGPDSDRPLTEEGIRQMKKVAKGMRRLGLGFDWILTSPYRRAFDTARMVAKVFKLEEKLRIARALAVDGDPKLLVKLLARHSRTWQRVLLVGHEPYLGQLMRVLVAGTDQMAIDLKKSGLAKLTLGTLIYGPCGTLEYLLTPRILKRLTFG